MTDIAIPISKIRRPRTTPKGRPVDPAARAEVARLLAGASLARDHLIENLHRVQDAHGHLSAANLNALAEAMKLSMAEVYEVATFYHHFDVVKEGEAAPARTTIRVCETLSCRMAGAAELLEKLPGLVGPDVRVVAAPCIGRCAEAPAVCVGHNAFGHATVAEVKKQIDGKKTAAPQLHPHTFADYVAQGGYKTWVECVTGKREVDDVIKTMEDAGLRGLGGAGFPSGRKWRIVRAEPGPRLMAVNIDEGEPGTFKDRHYLERDPHRFLEGMLIAAWAVGIDDIYVYLRDEYHACRVMLEREIAALEAHPPARLPNIHLRRGAGAYICGEESAMIESIEGKKGMPRLRPPYVAQVGVFGRPTLEHNMETLLWVRDLIEQGPEWFSKHGRNGRKGLRSFSVSGRVKKPGVHLAPAGITVKELIAEYCGGMLEGHELYAYLPGGASGGILPASMGDIPLDFDTLQPHGCFIGSAAVIVLSEHDRATDAARNLMSFFAHESCGQCTPCRSGTTKVRELIATDRWNLPLLAELSQVMRDASICGLGQAAPNPVDCVIRYFPQELSA
jgi:formate dehydrogenase